jgi:hypothetical protein
MPPLSPSHLLAASAPLLGLTVNEAPRHGRLLDVILAGVGERDIRPWSAAFVHHVGFWSHLDVGSGLSAWPLPATNHPRELAAFARLRRIAAESPASGDVFLRWSPIVREHVRAGIIATVDGLFDHPVTGKKCWSCRTIEGDTTDRGAPEGDGIHVVRRTLSVQGGDLFVRWADLDPREMVSHPGGYVLTAAGRAALRRAA